MIVLFVAYQVNQRHAFLKWLVTVKDDEVISYENINSCLVTVTTCLCVFTVMEMAATFCVNILVTGVMTIPLFYTGEPKIP